jgi:large subunit ribosomal protein L25
MTIKLAAQERTTLGKKLFRLRAERKIPAVVYGHGSENKNLELDYNTFEKAYNEAGESTLIDLAIGDQEALKVLIADVQLDPVRHRFTHIDFQQVKMDEKITATVELKFIGESKAVKEDAGVMVHSISEVEIECLPGDLIHEIKVDVSALATFDDLITIKDLNIPEKVKIIGHESDEVVATVNPPREEKEEAPQPVAAIEGEVAPEAGVSEAKAEEAKK